MIDLRQNVVSQAVALATPVCKVFEGFSFKPYVCPAGYWTIGWGHRCSKDQPEISRATGEALLRKDLEIAATAAIRLCPILLDQPPHRLAAIISWVFNLGAGRLQGSTMRRRINSKEWEQAARELRKWNLSAGKRLRGLMKRRAAEVALFMADNPRLAANLGSFDSDLQWIYR